MSTGMRLSDIIVFLFTLSLMLVGCKQGKENAAAEYEASIKSSTKIETTTIDTSLYGPHDVYVPPHDPKLDKRIKKAVASIADTTKIYNIYQYTEHNVVHILDEEDQTKTGLIYINKNLDKMNYVKISEKNAYILNYPIKDMYSGKPVYDVKGKTREQIEKDIPSIIWDNSGDPVHIYTLGVSSGFQPTNKLRGFQLNVIGTEGPMAVKSILYIEDKRGEFIDSIDLNGYEVWTPAITADGRFIAYEYGREFPREGRDTRKASFRIYDLQQKEIILDIHDYYDRGSRIVGKGNFFRTGIRF